jgi:hypothetical protein
MDKIDGDPVAQWAAANQLKAPDMPGSMARVGAPINPPGLVEGFVMSIVDKLAAVAAADYLTRVTGDIVNHANNIRDVSIEYSWADLTSAAGIVGATAKLGNQGVSLLKTVTGAGGTSGTDAATATETGKE